MLIAKKEAGGRGFISPVVLVLLCLLAAPLAVMVALAREETMLTHKEILRRRAFRLAEYAFREWSARADRGLPGQPPRSGLFDARAPWSSPPLTVRDNLGSYSSSAAFRLDHADQDGEAQTNVVLFNRAFGFAASPFTTGGYPVLDLHLAGGVGIHRADLRVALTWIPFLPPDTAALTVGGPVHLAGPALISGRPHHADGNEDASLFPGVPAVWSSGPLETDAGVDLAAAPGAVAEEILPARRLRDPYTVLGLPSAARYLEKIAYRNPSPPPWSGIVRFSGDYRGEVRGEGTIIVHNPLFDPVLDRASRDHAAGLDNQAWDPAYSHLDPARRPASLEPLGECLFRGVVIADDFLPGIGSLQVNGQLIILQSSGATLGMSGGLIVRYSREAVREFVHGDCDLVLDWHQGDGL